MDNSGLNQDCTLQRALTTCKDPRLLTALKHKASFDLMLECLPSASRAQAQNLEWNVGKNIYSGINQFLMSFKKWILPAILLAAVGSIPVLCFPICFPM